MMKTSGSKRRYVMHGRYAQQRHLQKTAEFDDLPAHESIKSTRQFYNGKINYGLLVRFLRRNVSEDWNQVHSEIIERIPTKLLDYKEMIFWFIADKVEMIDGRPWNKKSQQFIWTGEPVAPIYWPNIKAGPEYLEFYVDPVTNKIIRIEEYGKRRKRQSR